MNKKKAFVCTLLFTIVLCAIIVWSATIKNHDGISLYSLLAATGFGFWLSERITQFYDWLIKGDEKK